MVQVNIPSEAVNVVNFLLLDIILLPYILVMSSKLAGFANYRALNDRGSVHLIECKIPVVGDGMVMSRGWYRTTLIALRLAVFIFVAVANLGLEGRTVPDRVTRDAEIRVPGQFNPEERGFWKAFWLQVECVEIVNENYIFGSVIDNECFKEIRDYVSIHEMSAAFVERNLTLSRCLITSRNCKRSMYRCESIDLLCKGVSAETGCDNPTGIVPHSCAAVVYDNDDGGGIMCNSGNMVSETEAHLNHCRRFVARREDIVHWNDTYEELRDYKNNGMISVFAAAYGSRQKRTVTLSEGERIVTEIKLLWIIPTCMSVAMAFVLSLLVIWKCCQGSEPIVQDEQGLLRVLGKPVELVCLEEADDNIAPSAAPAAGCVIHQE